MPQEGEYNAEAEAHWMCCSRIWPPYGTPGDQARWNSIKEWFDTCPLEKITPLAIIMHDEPCGRYYELQDGYHRLATARQRGILMLLVQIWRRRPPGLEQIRTTEPMVFDRS